MPKIGVIILAAGKGTRMMSENPKVCAELGGKSLIQRVVNTSLQINVDLIGIVVGYKQDLVKKSINQLKNIKFITQEQQKGTGHAVKSANNHFSNFNGTVFILYGDVPLIKPDTLNKMLEIHRNMKAKCTVLTMYPEDTDRYGRIIRDENNHVKEIIEFKDASEDIKKIKEINTGIYCFECKELFSALEKIDNNNEQKEYYLTDVLKIIYNDKHKIESMILEDQNEAAGINSQSQLAELEKEHYKNIRDHWMKNGVRIENPETVLIEEDVIIENDVYISANSKIVGKSIIKKNSYIGPFSFIKNSTLLSNSFLQGMNVVENQNGLLKLRWQEILQKSINY